MSAENEYKASRHTILVACTVGTVVGDEVRKHKKWRLWDATDLAALVRRDLDREQARVLLAAHLGPGWAEQFLGVRALPAFQSPGLYFAKQLDRRHPFHDALSPVGRAADLVDVHRFVEASDRDVYLPTGVGGSGKSGLTLGLTEGFRARHPAWHAWVLTDGVPVTPEAARELPVGDCVLIVEDAHRRHDLWATLSLAKYRAGGRTELVLVSRLYGLQAIDAELAWAGVPPAGVVRPAPL